MATGPSISHAMTFSLWRGGDLLGHAELSAVTSVSVRAPVMSGPFVPTAAFADVWPVFAAWNRCGSELNARVQTFVGPDMAPEGFREQLLARVPDAVFRAITDAEQTVSALGLEVRDEAGHVVPDVSVQVNHLNVLSSVAGSPKALAELEAEAARQGITVSGYLMIVTRARPARPFAERSQPSVIPPAI